MPPAPARLFASDNAAGAHPLVIEALVRANSGHALAYGQDELTRRAEAKFSELFDADVRTLFVYGGTGANVMALASMLKPAEAVVCTSWAHIAMDETGAPERVLGAKLIDLPSPDGKLLPRQLQELSGMIGNQHHAQPGVVSITQPTELGTLYSAAEIKLLVDTAHDMGMLVHLDCARVANATAALGATVEALRSFTIDARVDVLSFGGTKAGGVFGEAVVFLNKELGNRAHFIRKQVTQLHSKMRFISAQYNALLTNNLFIDLGVRANAAARSLYDAVHDIRSLELTQPPAVNSLFPTISDPQKSQLQDWSFFWDWDVSQRQVRWMTAWDIEPSDVETFVTGVKKLID
ncbi:MAG: aminotransferase class V-fold PLP-dependent enzyme [Ilumatobacteraceae bacterium]